MILSKTQIRGKNFIFPKSSEPLKNRHQRMLTNDDERVFRCIKSRIKIEDKYIMLYDKQIHPMC